MSTPPEERAQIGKYAAENCLLELPDITLLAALTACSHIDACALCCLIGTASILFGLVGEKSPNFLDMLYYIQLFKMITLLPRAHAQRGKVIGFVVVVVSTKIARSRILGEFASANCS